MFGSNQTVDVSFQHSPSHLLLFSDGEQFLSSAIDEFNIFDINSKEGAVFSTTICLVFIVANNHQAVDTN